MFLEYYGLNEQPFGVTPDPRFLYLGSKHREALTALDYGTKADRGFLALIAKPGMGKTSLLFQYLEGLRNEARTALLFQTDGDSHDLMHYLLADLGLDCKGKGLPEMRSMLNEVLLEEMRAGRRFVLVIDEAQNLDEKALESIRLLSNFETPWAKLMQIVMAGQPQLAECLASPSMAQLRQRISFFIKIEPFTVEETDAYIDHRLWVAGYKKPQLFTVGARRLIAEHSEGVPRMINNICFGAMSLGWALKREIIDQEMICDVLADLDPGHRNETAAVVSPARLETEPKHAASQPDCPPEKDSPMQDLLAKLAAGGAILILLGWSVAHPNIVEARTSETDSQTLTAAPFAADPRAAAPAPSNSASDVPGSPIRRRLYNNHVSAEFRKLIR